MTDAPGPPAPRETPPLWLLLLAAFVAGFVVGEARAVFLSWAAVGWLR